ncbi:MAG: RHS repeat-associated core domain-containing protein, partial [Lachnospiraceae bacterium]|nr:RHS repeat-associated core domain-containing protein [Lachnospiraceae bacterium]
MTTFMYDCRNRLIQAGDTKYTYDAENNRIGVETNEKKIDYVINTQPELSQILQSTEIKLSDKDTKTTCNENNTYYFYGNGLISQDNGKDYFLYHFNNVGSTMAVTDAKGNIVETYNYTPYGELIDGEYRQDIPFLYNGQYGVTTDSNGLYYMRARYYNVDIKRFINQDVLLGVLERVSSLNRYAYVEGNPISYLDPFGLEKIAYYTQMHDDLSLLSAIIVGLQLSLAAIIVLNPATAPVVIPIEEGLNSISKVVSLLDTFALIMLGYNSDSTAEQVKYGLLSLWSGVSAFIGDILSFFKLTDDSEFSVLINSLIAGMEKIIGDGGVEGY